MRRSGLLITNGQCIHSMRRFGSPEQLRKTAESTLETGDPAYALALTEPGAGSDNNSATTSYTRKDGKVYLNGQKTFITGAKEYPYMLVLARDPEPKDPKKAFTLWWVESNKPGIKINPLHKIGWHMLSTCEVYLDNVEVDESDMVGEEGMGFLNVMYNFEMERLINAARSTGFAECAFEDAARYANQRIAFGKPIGHNQMIQKTGADGNQSRQYAQYGAEGCMAGRSGTVAAYQCRHGETVLRPYSDGSD